MKNHIVTKYMPEQTTVCERKRVEHYRSAFYCVHKICDEVVYVSAQRETQHTELNSL